MACPNCGCKVTYSFQIDDMPSPEDEYMERCAHCGLIFDGVLEGLDYDEPDIEDY